MGLKGKGVGEENVERQGGETGGSAEESELGNGKLGVVMKVSEKTSEVDN